MSTVWKSVSGLTRYFETVERHVLQNKKHRYSVQTVSNAIQYAWEHRKGGSVVQFPRLQTTRFAFVADATFDGEELSDAENAILSAEEATVSASQKKRNRQKRPENHNHIGRTRVGAVCQLSETVPLINQIATTRVSRAALAKPVEDPSILLDDATLSRTNLKTGSPRKHGKRSEKILKNQEKHQGKKNLPTNDGDATRTSILLNVFSRFWRSSRREGLLYGGSRSSC